MFMQRFDFVFDQRKARRQPMIDSFDVLQNAVASAMDAGAMQRGDVERHSQVVWAWSTGSPPSAWPTAAASRPTTSTGPWRSP